MLLNFAHRLFDLSLDQRVVRVCEKVVARVFCDPFPVHQSLMIISFDSFFVAWVEGYLALYRKSVDAPPFDRIDTFIVCSLHLNFKT